MSYDEVHFVFSFSPFRGSDRSYIRHPLDNTGGLTPDLKRGTMWSVIDKTQMWGRPFQDLTPEAIRMSQGK